MGESGIGGRQFELSSFGIADYLWVSADGRLDAFEFKLSDWRKGVSQAARYRSYCHRSFLVLPDIICKRIFPFLDEFRAVKIGLIGFDSGNGVIERYFIPPRNAPLNPFAYGAAVNILSRKRKLRNFYELT